MYLHHMIITYGNYFPFVEDYSQFFLRRVPEGAEPLQPYTAFLLRSKDRADPEPGPVGSLPVVCVTDNYLPCPASCLLTSLYLQDSPRQHARPGLLCAMNCLCSYFLTLRLCDVATLCKGAGTGASLAPVLLSL